MKRDAILIHMAVVNTVVVIIKWEKPACFCRPVFYYRALAAATAAATALIVATAIVVDEQQNNDDEQDPRAIVTAKQVSQTHYLVASFHRLQSILCPALQGGHEKNKQMRKSKKTKAFVRKQKIISFYKFKSYFCNQKLTLTDFDFEKCIRYTKCKDQIRSVEWRNESCV